MRYYAWRRDADYLRQALAPWRTKALSALAMGKPALGLATRPDQTKMRATQRLAMTQL
ncbi:hypothetical protein [Pseudomonas sp. RL_15y_Pfl2_60]|uniref:hypothetical protein n=1 Tax=Pseudomonas sp. RL_15y_Pfl2_60 TaxID=3088709 RepID=UPI00403F238D